MRSTTQRLGAQAQLDIPKVLPGGALGEGHDGKLHGAGEVFYVVVSVAAGNGSVKSLLGHKAHDLCADRLTEVQALLQE